MQWSAAAPSPARRISTGACQAFFQAKPDDAQLARKHWARSYACDLLPYYTSVFGLRSSSLAIPHFRSQGCQSTGKDNQAEPGLLFSWFGSREHAGLQAWRLAVPCADLVNAAAGWPPVVSGRKAHGKEQEICDWGAGKVPIQRTSL